MSRYECFRCKEEMIEVNITREYMIGKTIEERRYFVCPDCKRLIEIGSEKLCMESA